MTRFSANSTLIVAGALALDACRGSARTPVPTETIENPNARIEKVDTGEPDLPQMEPPTEPAPSVMQTAIFPADWCSRTGINIGDNFDVIADISDSYYVTQSATCDTAKLTQFADPGLEGDWLDYLFGYTNAMVGCPFIFDPVVDGFRTFGPANTASIGVSRPPLGRDDASLLIRMYLTEFARALALSSEESAAVEVYLWQMAEREIAPSVSQTLSACGNSP